MKKIMQKGFTLIELMIVVALVFAAPILIYVMSLWTDRNLDFWCTHFKGAVVNVPMWLSVVVTIVLNGVALLLNTIGEVARYFI